MCRSTLKQARLRYFYEEVIVRFCFEGAYFPDTYKIESAKFLQVLGIRQLIGSYHQLIYGNKVILTYGVIIDLTKIK